jgi:hypothetical protein
MNIVISYSRTKRRIDGPFQLCGSRNDLLRIADLIIQACHTHSKVTEDGGVRELF